MVLETSSPASFSAALPNRTEVSVESLNKQAQRVWNWDFNIPNLGVLSLFPLKSALPSPLTHRTGLFWEACTRACCVYFWELPTPGSGLSPSMENYYLPLKEKTYLQIRAIGHSFGRSPLTAVQFTPNFLSF